MNTHVRGLANRVDPSLKERPDDAAAAPGAEPRVTGADPKPRKKGGLRRVLLPLLLLAIVAGAAYYGHRWWTVGRFLVSTDDAYVQADVTTIVAKVNGYVSEIPVPENAHVDEGDVLLRIDSGDYDLAVQAAKDKIAAQEAAVSRIDRQIEAGRAAVDQARAQIASAEAGLRRGEADFGRADTLAARDFGSKQALDQARAARDSAQATLQGAKAGLAQAEATVAVTQAQRVEAEASLAELRTSLASAERDLTFTTIRAPGPGVIGNRAVEIGSFVSAGTRLMALVPMESLYVEANFKETQLADLVPGQEVELHVDAVDDVTLEGRIESISPASGSVFSLLPAQNATGNFTKVVQRVPVRIAITDPEAARVLRPGLSVVVDVDTRTGKPQGEAAE